MIKCLLDYTYISKDQSINQINHINYSALKISESVSAHLLKLTHTCIENNIIFVVLTTKH